MLPDRLLPHSVVIQTPGYTTDRYGNTVQDWSAPTETTARARIEMLPSDAVALREVTAGRDDAVSTWRIYTNTAINLRQRVVWDGQEFDVDGEVAPVYGASTLHHYEALLRIR